MPSTVRNPPRPHHPALVVWEIRPTSKSSLMAIEEHLRDKWLFLAFGLSKLGIKSMSVPIPGSAVIRRFLIAPWACFMTLDQQHSILMDLVTRIYNQSLSLRNTELWRLKIVSIRDRGSLSTDLEVLEDQKSDFLSSAPLRWSGVSPNSFFGPFKLVLTADRRTLTRGREYLLSIPEPTYFEKRMVGVYPFNSTSEPGDRVFKFFVKDANRDLAEYFLEVLMGNSGAELTTQWSTLKKWLDDPMYPTRLTLSISPAKNNELGWLQAEILVQLLLAAIHQAFAYHRQLENQSEWTPQGMYVGASVPIYSIQLDETRKRPRKKGGRV